MKSNLIKSFLYLTLTTSLITSCNSPTPIPKEIVFAADDQGLLVEEGQVQMESKVDMASSTAHFKLKLSKQELLNYVQSAIIPSYKDWVIFDNGTYIIFDNIDTIFDIQKTAIQWLKHYKPKSEQENNWNYSITELDKTNGWSVFGNGYGIYTIVHADELHVGASAQEIGIYAKAKRALDEKNPQIIYISSAKGIREI